MNLKFSNILFILKCSSLMIILIAGNIAKQKTVGFKEKEDLTTISPIKNNAPIVTYYNELN